MISEATRWAQTLPSWHPCIGKGAPCGMLVVLPGKTHKTLFPHPGLAQQWLISQSSPIGWLEAYELAQKVGSAQR